MWRIPKIIEAGAETLRNRNKELACEVREEGAHANVESTWLNVVTEVPVSVKVRLALHDVENANSRGTAYSIGKGANKVEKEVNSALMAESGEDTDAPNPKVSITCLR